MNKERKAKLFSGYTNKTKKNQLKIFTWKTLIEIQKFFVRIRIRTKTKNYFNTPTTGCWLFRVKMVILSSLKFLFGSRKKKFSNFSFKTKFKINGQTQWKKNQSRFPVVLLDLKLRFFISDLIWFAFSLVWMKDSGVQM